MDPRHLLPLLALLLACGDPKEDTSSTETGETDTEETEVEPAFSVSGTALNLMDPASSAAAEGLCIRAADPTPALQDEPIVILAESTVGAAGAYSVPAITTTSVIGLLMLVEDCAGEGTVLPTATGLPAEDYAGLADGAVIEDFTSWSIDGASRTVLAEGLATAGYTGDIATEGALLGFVLDASGNPVVGAKVFGRGDPTYYFDGTGFTADSTTAEGRGMWIIPAAPIYTYNVSADGYDFPDKLTGSQAGYAVVATFRAM